MTQAVNLATVGSNANSGGTLITSGTAQASTSGTSIDFTGIPSWVKRVTVMFNGVSTNGSNDYLIQIGSGSVLTSGYANCRAYITNATASASSPSATSGIVSLPRTSASTLTSGQTVLTLIGSNVWIGTANIGEVGGTLCAWSSGNSGTLSGALDRVRITTVGGTETFDAGSINILYE